MASGDPVKGVFLGAVPRVLWMLLLAAGCGPAPKSGPVDAVGQLSADSPAPHATTETTTTQSTAPNPHRGPVHFRFLSVEESGIDFTYYGNPSPEHYMTEQNGGGVALFDFDRDGAVDLFLVNGSNFSRPADPKRETHRLYRNRLTTGESPMFQDISRDSGLNVTGFGMGVAAGDFDNDGFGDLYICYYGEDQLWHNNGDGTFSNVTTTAGTTDPAWSASAAFGDLDGDGDLDLYVANYVVYLPTEPPCFTQHQTPIKISCGPIGRKGEPDRLWENLGDGRFVDASDRSGIHAVQPGKGLAVEIVDLDGDDRLDIYVANDTSENFLFHNEGEMRFSETGTVSGVAYSADGSPGSSMGIACADFDRNGRLDLFVTNFENATNDYYDNRYEYGFLHRSGGMGLDIPSRPMLAFGTVAADFDLDGWPDLFVANGHIWDLTPLQFGHLYQMPPQLFHNDMGTRFTDESTGAGDYFARRWLGRAVALGDLDNDGDPDLVVTHELQSAVVLLNDGAQHGRNATVQIIGNVSARDALGIRVTYRVGTTTRIEHVPAGGSFQASHDSRVILSCGDADSVDELTVDWDVDWHQTWKRLPIGCELILTEGKTEYRTRSRKTSL